jgi:hypothetical protein
MKDSFVVGMHYVCHGVPKPIIASYYPGWSADRAFLGQKLLCEKVYGNGNKVGQLSCQISGVTRRSWFNAAWVENYSAGSPGPSKHTVNPSAPGVKPIPWHAGMPIGGGVIISGLKPFPEFGRAVTGPKPPAKCSCSLWTGCVCGEFEKEMKKAGKVYDPFMRIWTNLT